MAGNSQSRVLCHGYDLVYGLGYGEAGVTSVECRNDALEGGTYCQKCIANGLRNVPLTNAYLTGFTRLLKACEGYRWVDHPHNPNYAIMEECKGYALPGESLCQECLELKYGGAKAMMP